MRTRLFATLAVATLALTACGGGGGKQDEVADMMIEQLDEEGVDIDEGCLRDATSKLSDEDAQKLIDAGLEGDPDLSDEAEAAADEAINCIDTGAIVDQMIDEMVAEMGEENVDADCIRDAADGLDLANLDEGDGEFMGALLECITIGG